MAKFGSVFESSERSDWETPQEIFDCLDKEFRFTLDVCAGHDNTKVALYISEQQNGLIQDWSHSVCWMNPPFKDKKKWIEKAYKESLKDSTIVVCLIPARTNTNWWHQYCMKGEIRFICGRPKFKGAIHGLPQPLAIVIFGRVYKGGSCKSFYLK